MTASAVSAEAARRGTSLTSAVLRFTYRQVLDLVDTRRHRDELR